jgi:hypothetical protein
MSGRIRVERVYADNLVVGARCNVFAVRGEADCVDGARVVTDRSQLLGLRILGVVRVQDGFGRPYAYVAI